MQSNTACVRALTNNTLIQRELCSCKVCETLQIQERNNVWASRINLKKTQWLRALPLLHPSSQVCSTHILQLILGACGGSACPQQSSAGSQTSSSPGLRWSWHRQEQVRGFILSLANVRRYYGESWVFVPFPVFCVVQSTKTLTSYLITSSI